MGSNYDIYLFNQYREYHDWDELEFEDVKRSVERGDVRAKTKLAWLKLSGNGGADVDAEGAVALLEERVEDSDNQAMWMLGVCYEYGIGIEQNAERAEWLYRISGGWAQSGIAGFLLSRGCKASGIMKGRCLELDILFLEQ